MQISLGDALIALQAELKRLKQMRNSVAQNIRDGSDGPIDDKITRLYVAYQTLTKQLQCFFDALLVPPSFLQERIVMRPVGFYWVMLNGESKYETACFDGLGWLLTGKTERLPDEAFSRIATPVPPPWSGYEPQ